MDLKGFLYQVLNSVSCQITIVPCSQAAFSLFFSLGGKICLFYSWVSFGVWKGKIDSAPVGYQWTSDPEKEMGRVGGRGGLRGSLALQTTSILTWVPLFGP